MLARFQTGARLDALVGLRPIEGVDEDVGVNERAHARGPRRASTFGRRAHWPPCILAQPQKAIGGCSARLDVRIAGQVLAEQPVDRGPLFEGSKPRPPEHLVVDRDRKIRRLVSRMPWSTT